MINKMDLSCDLRAQDLKRQGAVTSVELLQGAVDSSVEHARSTSQDSEAQHDLLAP